MEYRTTARGFALYEFQDRNGEKCSLQKSSIATEDCIWLGIDDANPVIMASDVRKLGLALAEANGWVPYPIPPEVLLSTRMHLTRKQVKALLPILKHFAKTGEVVNLPKKDKK